jgi:hypothetical protein
VYIEYRVGSSRLPAGGVEEVVAWLEWCFGVAFILFGGVAPWSSAADRPPFTRLQVRGAAVCAFPHRSPRCGGSGFDVSEGVDVGEQGDSISGAGWRLFGAEV